MTDIEEQTLRDALSDRIFAILSHFARSLFANQGGSPPLVFNCDTPGWLLEPDMLEQYQELGESWLVFQPADREAELREELGPAVERLAKELVGELDAGINLELLGAADRDQSR
jgi:hypothetical protein